MSWASASRPAAHAHALRAAFLLIVTGCLLTYGSSGAVPQAIWSAALAALAVMIVLTQGPAVASTWNDHGAVVGIACALVAWTVLQSAPLGIIPHPSWMDAAFDAHAAISAEPAAGVSSLHQLISPFLVFSTARLLFPDLRLSHRLALRLAAIAAAVALLGIVQYQFSPGTLLLFRKDFHVDSLTGVFVNRNTAASLFGVAALIWICLILREARIVGPGFLRRCTFRRHRRLSGHYRTVVKYGAMALICLLALGLTKSRAGTVSFAVGAIAASGVMAIRRERPVLSWALASGLVALMLFGVFSERAVYRADLEGFNDLRWCVYERSFSMFADRVWTGTGFGTFGRVFPQYRDPSCGASFTWDRAHNVYLETAVTLGLPGLAMAAGLVALYFRRVWLCIRMQPERLHAGALGMGVGVTIAFHSVFDFSLQVYGFGVFFAAVCAAVWGLCPPSNSVFEDDAREQDAT